MSKLSWGVAAQIARDPVGVGREGIEELRAVGYDDAGVVAVVTTCAMPVSANVIADAVGLDPADRAARLAGHAAEQ
jgi:hypothetical protein